MPRRAKWRVRHGQLGGGFDRRALEGQHNPFAPGKTGRPDRRVSDFEPPPRQMRRVPFLVRSVVDNLVRSWPSARRAPVTMNTRMRAASRRSSKLVPRSQVAGRRRAVQGSLLAEECAALTDIM